MLHYQRFGPAMLPYYLRIRNAKGKLSLRAEGTPLQIREMLIKRAYGRASALELDRAIQEAIACWREAPDKIHWAEANDKIAVHLTPARFENDFQGN